MTPQLARKGNEPTAKTAVEAKGLSPPRDPCDPLDYPFFPRQVAASEGEQSSSLFMLL